MSTAALQHTESPNARHQVPGASFSAEALELRKRTLGASEVPAVLGLDRYKGPHQVWLVKRGIAPAFEGNAYSEWGLRVEPVIRQKVAEVLGVTIEIPGTLIHPQHDWVSASPDGQMILDGEVAVLELKNKTARQSVYWGVAGTDEVPHDIAAQAYWQMFVTGARRAVVGVLFDKADFRIYYLNRDDEIVDSIFARCADFWQAHVIGGVEPEIGGAEATRDYLIKRFSLHGDVLRSATGDEDRLIQQLRGIRKQQKALEEQESVVKNKLMAAIGEDAGLQGTSGRVTWKRPNGWQVAWKDIALALNAPQSLIDQHSTPMARKFVPFFPKED